MTRHDPVVSIQVSELHIASDMCMEWDEAEHTLRLVLVTDQTHVITLNFHEGHKLRRPLTEDAGPIAGFIKNLIDLHGGVESENWQKILAVLAREMIRMNESCPEAIGYKAGVDLAKWLAPLALSEECAWLAPYHPALRPESSMEGTDYCYKILKESIHRLKKTVASDPHRRAGGMDRNLWWTARCLYRETLEEKRRCFPRAASHFRHASEIYLNLLMDSAFRQQQANFFNEMDSSLETEVRDVIWMGQPQLNPRALNPALDDESDARTCQSWLLRRYMLVDAAQLILTRYKQRRTHLRIYSVWSIIALTGWASVLVGYTSLFHWDEYSPVSHHVATHIRDLICAAAIFGLAIVGILQIILIGILNIFTPNLFRLLLPRALFGSLLAWVTVIPALLSNVCSLPLSSKTNGEVLGMYLQDRLGDSHAWWIPFVISLPGFLLAAALMLQEVRNSIEHLRGNFVLLVKRSLLVALIALFSSCYWGAFAAAGAVAYTELVSGASCTIWYFLFITLVGGSLALPFGMAVQIIWQEKYITDPMLLDN